MIKFLTFVRNTVVIIIVLAIVIAIALPYLPIDIKIAPNGSFSVTLKDSIKADTRGYDNASYEYSGRTVTIIIPDFPTETPQVVATKVLAPTVTPVAPPTPVDTNAEGLNSIGKFIRNLVTP